MYNVQNVSNVECIECVQKVVLLCNTTITSPGTGVQDFRETWNSFHHRSLHKLCHVHVARLGSASRTLDQQRCSAPHTARRLVVYHYINRY